jgi:cob(I)alamin adenosyltransferase
MIIVFTGNGKGKTTASLGQMVRVVGRGKRALMIQFIKGPWRSGEDEFSDKFQATGDMFKIRKMGKGFVGILGDKLPREEHEKAAREALEFFTQEVAKDPAREGWQLIVLDEVNVAVSLGLITANDVLEAIKDFPEERLLILGGRGAPQEFVDRADLVTEMREIKHPYNEGKLAKLGIEF